MTLGIEFVEWVEWKKEQHVLRSGVLLPSCTPSGLNCDNVWQVLKWTLDGIQCESQTGQHSASSHLYWSGLVLWSYKKQQKEKKTKSLYSNVCHLFFYCPRLVVAVVVIIFFYFSFYCFSFSDFRPEFIINS